MAINRSLAWTEWAKQSAKDVPETIPLFAGEARAGGLTPTREVQEMNVADGNMWGTSYTWVKTIGAGGSPRMVGKPLMLGSLINGVLGTDTKTGGGDPYTHTMTPAATTPWHTFFARLDTLYQRFPNVKILELLIEGSVDDGFLFLTPTLGIAGRPLTIAAPDAVAAETLTFPWYSGKGYWVVDGDYTNPVQLPLATDLTTAYALANSIQTKYNAHRVLVVAPHHAAADTVNTSTAPAATTQGTLDTLINELKAKLNAHRSQATVHVDDDTDNEVTSPDGAGTLAAALLLVNELRADFNAHMGVIGSISTFSIKISRGSTPVQGEDVVMHDFPGGKGRVEASFDVLVENFHRYNKLYYGATHPAAETEINTTLFSGNFHLKMIAQTTAERSLEITIPVLRYTDPGSIEPDPDGAPAVATIAGLASGTDPVITCVVQNSRSSAY